MSWLEVSVTAGEWNEVFKLLDAETPSFLLNGKFGVNVC